MLSTFGDHNPSESELYNKDPLNVEKLLCGQYFLKSDRRLTRGWKTFRDSYDNFPFPFLCIFMLITILKWKNCVLFNSVQE